MSFGRKKKPAGSSPSGAGAVHADAAPAARPSADDRDPDGPSSRPIPREADEKPDQLRDKKAASENHQEALIDESVEESFPASDPPTPKRIT